MTIQRRRYNKNQNKDGLERKAKKATRKKHKISTQEELDFIDKEAEDMVNYFKDGDHNCES